MKIDNIYNIQEIANYLIDYKESLDALYKWDYDSQKALEKSILTKDEIERLSKLSSFEKNVKLKLILSKKLSESYVNSQRQFFNICMWIVKDWGGIRAAKEEKVQSLALNFIKTKNLSFQNIASSSKIAEFAFPEKHIIYDSRVAYSLNWILLKLGADKNFFPVPEGRNSKMNAFDIKVLIRLKSINKYLPSKDSDIEDKRYISKADKNLFLNKDVAYKTLQKLIKAVNTVLWADSPIKQKYPFYTEMVLFAIADNKITLDILKSLNLMLK